jgi:hypothetical protein
MIVYFDKANYIKYLQSYSNSDDGIDTLRMIKKQLNVHLNFKVDEFDDYEFILHEEFETGIAQNFKLTQGIDLINRPLKKDSFPTKNGIYLLNHEDVSKIKMLHSVLIGSVNEEVSTLLSLVIDEDYSFHLEKIIGKDITPINHLDILNLPFSTLVVVDRYMFKGPEIGGNLGLYEYNLDKILKKIFLNKQGHSRLIFVYQVKINVPTTNVLYDIGPDLEKLTQKIKKVISKNCPSPEIFLIGVPDGYIDDEHDRYIISDYLRVKSGDSFVYFTSTNTVKTDSKAVDFYSLANKQYYVGTKVIVSKLSEIVEKTLNQYPQFSKVPIGTESNMVINFT